ncbi:PIG-L family deacetylase [Kiritimatiellaeota bacterium B1221]|nr:PIG-L family deacetylase [Kiritimatiellaeota bacterium B1221]
MKLNHPDAHFFVPDHESVPKALQRCNYLGIGAHPDDLEFMSLHGILAALDRGDQWFGGVTCTDGIGSARQGAYADVSASQMREIRRNEQDEAAGMGQYSFMAQLGYSSEQAKTRKLAGEMIDDIEALLIASRPEILYTHNLTDKHPTHIGVVMSVIEAVRRLPSAQRPAKMIGCEGWRNLDWLSDDEKLVLDVSGREAWVEKLNAVFASQIEGGKRYDLAVEGRRRANATFFNAHTVDLLEKATYAMDLTPLLKDDALDPLAYALGSVDRFRQDVESKLGHFYL